MNLCIRKIIYNLSDVNMSGNSLPVFDVPSMLHTELSVSLRTLNHVDMKTYMLPQSISIPAALPPLYLIR